MPIPRSAFLTLSLLALPAFAIDPALQAAADAAQESCERDRSTCARRDDLQEQVQAARRAEGEARDAQRQAERDRSLAEGQQEIDTADRKEASTRTHCGARYMRPRIGEAWTAARDCLGVTWLAGETATFKVYRFSGGALRVEHGKITRWITQ